MASNDEDLSRYITYERIIDYAEVKRANPVSIETIQELVGGPNMPYICCNGVQSEFVFKTVRDEFVKLADDPKLKIHYFQEKQSPLMNVIFIVIMIPKTANRREHMVLWGCTQILPESRICQEV